MVSINKIANRLIIGGSILSVGMGSFLYVIRPGEAAIKFNQLHGGIKKEVYSEGLHWKIPWVENVIKYNVRLNCVDIPSNTSTKDQQQIRIGLRVLYKPVEEEIANIHLTWGPNYKEKVLTPVAMEVIKMVLAQYDADQLLKQREKISSQIRSLYINKIKEYNLVIQDVALADIDFSEKYKKSIEDKQIAQQMAEREKYIVEKKEHLMKADLLEVEGRSEAAKLISEAYRKHGDAYIKLKKLEASRKIAENLTSNPNVAFVPQTSNFLLNM